MFNSEKLKTSLWGRRQVCPFSSLLFNTALKILGIAIGEEKEVKGIQNGKEEVELSMFTEDMIVCIEDPKDATRKLLELINEFGKFVGSEINTQKYLGFLYTKNKRSEREIKETVPFII